MRRRTALLVAVAFPLIGAIAPATGARAQTSAPFEEVVLPSGKKPGHAWAYASMVAGAAIVGVSFAVKARADSRYDGYLTATEPDQISTLYDETITLDRLSATSLIAGEVLVGLGLYLRFVKRDGSQTATTGAARADPPNASHTSPSFGLELHPARWAVSLRF